MYKVAVTDYTFKDLKLEKEILEPLGCEITGRQCNDQQELIALVDDADYVITQYAKINTEVINSMKKCKLIVRYGIGVDNVDINTAREKGIPVCNVPDYCIDEVADHTLALILSLSRRVVEICSHVREGSWKLSVPLEKMHVLKEMTVGIVGYGRIGREVAKRLMSFKCPILVFDPVVDASAIEKSGCMPVTFDELLKMSDIITLHCPSNAKTRYMVNEDSIKKMKKGVLLVNTSRGDLIRTNDLIKALKSGKIEAAGLDVIDPEPINSDSPLLKMGNVIITNHIASASVSAVEHLRKSVASTIACAIRGETLPNVVNK